MSVDPSLFRVAMARFPGAVVLTRDEGELAMCFAGANGATGEDKFTNGDRGSDWGEDAYRLPILNGAILSFSCQVCDEVEAGSHSVDIGRITDTRTSGDRKPLLYERSNFHVLPAL